MRFFPPNMYDPQINMIRKPFVLNKEKLRQDFNSPKYENRRKEFFATFSEFLRSYIRDKYYEFMNDIQTEVNFFEWFDHYFKPKLLAGRNTNFPLQKEATHNSQDTIIKHKSTYDTSYSHNNLLHSSIETTKNSPIMPNKTKPKTLHCLQSIYKTIPKPIRKLIKNSLPQPTYSYSPSQDTPPNIQPLTKNHTNNITHATSASILSPTSGNIHIATRQQDKHSMTPLTSNYQFNNNTHLDKKQTILSQYGQINTIKKNKKDNNYKDKKKSKKETKKEKQDVGSPPQVGSPTKNSKDKEELKSDMIDPLTKIPKEKAKNKVLCYKCNKFGHYQNNCKPPKNKSKLNIPELHSEINTLKQEIQEIKNSSFQITEEQLAQEMVTLKINNNHSQNSSIENEVEPEENCKQIVQLISQPTFKETFLNTIDKMLFQKWYTEVRIVIDKEYIFETVALLDTGADSNCIQEGLIPTKYYEKTTEKLSQASGTSLNIEFKLSNAHVCREGVCIKTTFILVKDITSKVILGNPFIALLYPITQISEKRTYNTNFRTKGYFSFYITAYDKRYKYVKTNDIL
jgi:hypothetical protein